MSEERKLWWALQFKSGRLFTNSHGGPMLFPCRHYAREIAQEYRRVSKVKRWPTPVQVEVRP